MITKALLYCTKNYPMLYKNKLGQWYIDDKKFIRFAEKQKLAPVNYVNGHVVAVCDIEVEEIFPYLGMKYTTNSVICSSLLKRSCLTMELLDKYLESNYKNNKCGYAIHIKNLKVFDEPHKLGETFDIGFVSISLPNKAPQNMQSCWAFEIVGGIVMPVSDYALISIQPQWLVKILNGEKTIEVRKKVLKEMIK